MKIIFFCGHESLFGRQSLEALLKSRLKPDVLVAGNANTWKRFDEQLNNAHSPSFSRRLRKIYYRWKGKKWLKKTTQENNLQLEVIEDLNSAKGITRLKGLEADLFICSAYPQIVQHEWLALPRIGAIGFHPSLLPAFRGAHPHFWAIRKGAKETGISAYWMTERIDDGEILAQIRFNLYKFNYGALYRFLGKKLPKLIDRLSYVLLDNRAVELFNEDMEPSYFSNNQLKDSRIFWKRQLIEEIDCVIRTGIAWCVYRTRVLRILDGRVYRELAGASTDLPVGSIVELADKKIYVSCLDGWLEVFDWKWKYSVLRPRLKDNLF